MDRTAVSQQLTEVVAALAAWAKPFFPCHAAALNGEIINNRMTDERWSRVTMILASFHAVPGVMLTMVEHDVRNTALAVLETTRRMARIGFEREGAQKISLEYVAYTCNDFRGRIPS